MKCPFKSETPDSYEIYPCNTVIHPKPNHHLCTTTHTFNLTLCSVARLTDTKCDNPVKQTKTLNL